VVDLYIPDQNYSRLYLEAMVVQQASSDTAPNQYPNTKDVS